MRVCAVASLVVILLGTNFKTDVCLPIGFDPHLKLHYFQPNCKHDFYPQCEDANNAPLK